MHCLQQVNLLERALWNVELHYRLLNPWCSLWIHLHLQYLWDLVPQISTHLHQFNQLLRPKTERNHFWGFHRELILQPLQEASRSFPRRSSPPPPSRRFWRGLHLRSSLEPSETHGSMTRRSGASRATHGSRDSPCAHRTTSSSTRGSRLACRGRRVGLISRLVRFAQT